jgi:hypothetical protein
VPSVDKTVKGDPPGDQNFEEIEIAEEELIDAYVRGQLPADERRLLEKGLLTSPELVDRLHFARLLADAAEQASGHEVSSERLHDKHPTRRKSWLPFWWMFGERPAFQMSIAAAALIVVIGGAGVLAGWIRLRRESQQLAEQQAALERQKSELQKSAAEQQLIADQLRAQLREEKEKRAADQQAIKQTQNQNSGPTSAATVATFFLLPTTRSDKEKELTPAAGTSRIRLQLGVESIDYSWFVPEVRNSHDEVIFQPKVRPPRSGKSVTITLPSKLLPPGAYSIQLSGISSHGETELVGNYSFRIAPAQK